MFNPDEPRDARGRWAGGGLPAMKAGWRDEQHSLAGGHGLAQALLTHAQLSMPSSRRFRQGWNDPAVAGHLSGLIDHWSDAGSLDDDAFLDRYLAHDASLKTVRALRAAAAKAVTARTAGDLAQAGDHLATAIGEVGVEGWPNFLKAAYRRAGAGGTSVPKDVPAHRAQQRLPHPAAAHAAGDPNALTYDQIKEVVAHNNRSGLSNELVIAIIYKESSFDPSKHNKNSNAEGLMQIVDVSRKYLIGQYPNLGQIDWLSPVQNVIAGTLLLADKLKETHGNVAAAIWKFGPGLKQSPNYVPEILAAAEALRQSPADPVPVLERILHRGRK